MAQGFLVTEKGKALLAKITAGEQENLDITRVMVGSGELSEEDKPEYFDDLMQPVAQASSTIPMVKNNVISFIVEYRNDMNGGLKNSFWLKEFGVFVKDGEQEILLYYATLEAYPQYVEAHQNGKLSIKKYPVSIAVSNIASDNVKDIKVTMEYSPIAFVTEERLKEFTQSETLPYLQEALKNSDELLQQALESKADKQTVTEELAKKADKETVTTALEGKANVIEVEAALNKKANTETVQAALEQKANVEAVQRALKQKADTQAVQQALEQKADEMEMLTELAKKVDKENMIEQLAAKADKEEIQKELDKKVNKEDIEGIVNSADMALELDKKADKETVAEELAKKADAKTMQGELNKKADSETVQTELDKKADNDTMAAALALKADSEIMTTELEKKANTSHEHSADDIKSGILPIANGGTGNTTGNAATATKLQTARTLALSGDATGSVSFDGSANKTITATLANSGVKAGTYGAIELVSKNSGTVWVSNNVGLHGTSAISTWTAKQACKLSFRWRISSESVGCDYLNITAAGTQILANTGGTTEQTGTLTATLAAGQTIVFTYRKDGSVNNGIDRAEISEIKYGAGTADPSTVIYENNVESYFTIKNDTYGFYPAIPIANITVDAKGRITKEQTTYVSPTWVKKADTALSANALNNTLPISKGGTGATSASTALSNLGGFSKSGGTISGDVAINGKVSEGSSIASGPSSHAEGSNTKTLGYYGHSEGYKTTAGGRGSHAEGAACAAYKFGAHAEGVQTIACNYILKIKSVDTATKKIVFDSTYNGYSTAFSKIAVGLILHVLRTDYGAEADRYTISSIDSTNHAVICNESISEKINYAVVMPDENSALCAHAEGNGTIASGSSSHAEGVKAVASGSCAHAEGYGTTASGSDSHAEGSGTTASGGYTHAEGDNTIASGSYAHAEGYCTTASGSESHAEGDNTIASGNVSHAGGYHTKASALYQMAIGKYNKESTAETDKFIIGNGTSDTARSNCLRVTNTNGVYSNSTYKSSGADYAETFEWEDGNRNNEDRTGLFVTLTGDKIRLATPEDSYILGIVSACPSICGDVRDDIWGGMFLTTIFGSPILEEVEIPERTEQMTTTDENGKEVTQTIVIEPAHTEIRQKLNPEYDYTKEYIPRSERPEWDAVGVLGKLVAVDDGSCEVDGWCKVGQGGIATKSEEVTKYRVMKRLDETHIKVFIT